MAEGGNALVQRTSCGALWGMLTFVLYGTIFSPLRKSD